ncbi:MAG TPA: FdtA/QdtA family cupin domain-containing protein [Holophagaceae bacterium]|nr:FdtA/QdtA family cupin domain-containing protein [Holophagaceae bacterium]
MSLRNCRLLELPRIPDARGSLTFIEGEVHIPFPIARIYYLYEVPGGESRGGHAHRDLEQVIVALNGSFDVALDDGHGKATYQLDRPDQGLYLSSGVWRELHRFTPGSVCLVLASRRYDEGDYYRDYEGFLEAVARGEFQP